MEGPSSLVGRKTSMFEEPEASNASRVTRNPKGAIAEFAERLGRDPRSSGIVPAWCRCRGSRGGWILM